MSNQQRFTITAALPYTNGPIHIGHLAGVYVPADIFARYQRIAGNDVAFICGSDEHGVPITLRAKKEGVSPQEIVDRYHKQIKESFKDFRISFDHYGRTTSETHKETAQDFFKHLLDRGKFVEQTTEQLYDPEADQFLADRFVKGTCPKCGNPESYGDQCEKCGTSHNATDLIDPVSAITGNKPELKETSHWFLPLDEYGDWLQKWIVDGHAHDWKNNVTGQVASWLNDGLRPRAVTRDLDWGIPVPVEGADGKVLYVWFDAPIGYISATKEWAKQNERDWEEFWKQDDTRLVQFIGKDNIVFHCIIFPSMLKAHGEFVLPDNVPANEFLNLEDEKISTSRDWAVWLHEYLADFPDQQDVLRYVLTKNAPETKDNNFTWKDFQAHNNNELVAIFGNFINRVVVLTHKYYDGKIPEASRLNEADQHAIQEMNAYPGRVAAAIEQYRFRESVNLLIDLARTGNKYLAEQEPWKSVKTDSGRTATVMHTAMQIAAALAVLSEPLLPHTSEKLKDILNISKMPAARTRADLVKVNWQDISEKKEPLYAGHLINKGELLFRKIEDAEIEKQLDKLKKPATTETPKNSIELMPQKETIQFDNWMDMDIRVGTILSAEKMPKADRLLKLEVDTGIDQRTIVSGIAEHFTPEEVIGKKVSVLVNLAPRKLRGVESQGMILMAETADGQLRFMSPDGEDVPNGQVVS